MADSLDSPIYVRLAEAECNALDSFATSQPHPVTRSAVVRAAVLKWLVEAGKLPSDYSQARRTKYQTRAGRETVFDMTKHDKISA